MFSGLDGWNQAFRDRGHRYGSFKEFNKAFGRAYGKVLAKEKMKKNGLEKN